MIQRAKRKACPIADLEVLALDDGDGEAGDGLVEADGEEDLGPLVGQVRRLGGHSHMTSALMGEGVVQKKM